MNDSSFQLDEEAERLFQELGGIDTRERDISPNAMDRLAGRLDEEEEQLDPYRVLLVGDRHPPRFTPSNPRTRWLRETWSRLPLWATVRLSGALARYLP